MKLRTQEEQKEIDIEIERWKQDKERGALINLENIENDIQKY